jgi:hypothetical protein
LHCFLDAASPTPANRSSRHTILAVVRTLIVLLRPST